jgi:hypothetical protein
MKTILNFISVDDWKGDAFRTSSSTCESATLAEGSSLTAWDSA